MFFKNLVSRKSILLAFLELTSLSSVKIPGACELEAIQRSPGPNLHLTNNERRPLNCLNCWVCAEVWVWGVYISPMHESEM